MCKFRDWSTGVTVWNLSGWLAEELNSQYHFVDECKAAYFRLFPSARLIWWRKKSISSPKLFGSVEKFPQGEIEQISIEQIKTTEKKEFNRTFNICMLVIPATSKTWNISWIESIQNIWWKVSEFQKFCSQRQLCFLLIFYVASMWWKSYGKYIIIIWAMKSHTHIENISHSNSCTPNRHLTDFHLIICMRVKMYLTCDRCRCMFYNVLFDVE